MKGKAITFMFVSFGIAALTIAGVILIKSPEKQDTAPLFAKSTRSRPTPVQSLPTLPDSDKQHLMQVYENCKRVSMAKPVYEGVEQSHTHAGLRNYIIQMNEFAVQLELASDVVKSSEGKRIVGIYQQAYSKYASYLFSGGGSEIPYYMTVSENWAPAESLRRQAEAKLLR